MNSYDARSTVEQLKVMRHYLVTARQILWDLDDGRTEGDRPFQNGGVRGGGMHPDVRNFQTYLDECIMLTAQMQDKT